MTSAWRMGPVAWLMACGLWGCTHQPLEVSLVSLPLAPMEASPTSAPSASSASSAAARLNGPLAVRRVQIPEYLQSNHVRYRAAAESLVEWPGARWAERLEVSLTRHLSQALERVMPIGSQVCDTSCTGGVRAASLHVSYQQLDYLRSAGILEARVIWTWTPPTGSASEPRMERITLREPVQVDSAAGQAAAMARLNAQVAERIVRGLAP